MALTVTALAAALRLGDGINAPAEPINGILVRLMGAGDALVDLQAGSAPSEIKEEAVIRFCGYLYDMPTASAGQRYANAWVNSGAGGLVARWVEHGTPADSA